MQNEMFSAKVNVTVTKIMMKAVPNQGAQQVVVGAVQAEGIGEGRTQREAFDAAMANGVAEMVEKLSAVEVVKGAVVTPFSS